MSRYFRMLAWCFLLLTAVCSPFAVATTYAQGQVCFAETGYCVQGRFLQYWQQNGGLAVFGFPLNNEQSQNGTTSQYFERQRFEYHPENAPPYDVLLGRLGVDRLTQAGIDWTKGATAPGPVAGCMWFPETQHNVCDQQPGNGFRTAWLSNGLSFDGQPGVSYGESLALFGLPITEPYIDTIEGRQVQIQYFERARFEWHPENAVPFNVLFGRLGAEVFSGSTPTPPTPVGPAFNDTSTAVNTVSAFYDAINRRDYGRAYGYWSTPPTDYQSFVNGYADTASIRLIVEPPTFISIGAGNLQAAVPSAIVATRRDGSNVVFAGCYVNTAVQPAGGSAPSWKLSQAAITQAASDQDIVTMMDQQCAAFGLPSPSAPSNQYANRTWPIELIASFYNAVNRRDYGRAFSYWETPPTDYQSFVNGYAATANVRVFVQPPASIDIGAGNAYGSVPTVLLATQTDGSVQLFSGCYVAHRVNIDPNSQWGINRATIAPTALGPSVPSLLATACSR